MVTEVSVLHAKKEAEPMVDTVLDEIYNNRNHDWHCTHIDFNRLRNMNQSYDEMNTELMKELKKEYEPMEFTLDVRQTPVMVLLSDIHKTSILVKDESLTH